MKLFQIHFRNVLTLVMMVASVMVFAAKPNIVILATGGTIAGAGASSTGSAYTSGPGQNRSDDRCCAKYRDLCQPARGEQLAECWLHKT
jgi:hypothetical protein